MSYNVDIYLVKKSNRMRNRNISKKCLFAKFKQEDWPFRKDIVGKVFKGQHMLSLGEPTWEYNEQRKYESKLFNNNSVHNYYNDDTQLILINNNFLKFIIEHYRIKMMEFLQKNIESIDSIIKIENKGLNLDIKHFLEKKKRLFREDDSFGKDINFNFLVIGLISEYKEWENYQVVNLGEECITKSSKFRYIVFELASIYKNTDWSKYELILTAG